MINFLRPVIFGLNAEKHMHGLNPCCTKTRDVRIKLMKLILYICYAELVLTEVHFIHLELSYIFHNEHNI